MLASSVAIMVANTAVATVAHVPPSAAIAKAISTPVPKVSETLGREVRTGAEEVRTLAEKGVAATQSVQNAAELAKAVHQKLLPDLGKAKADGGTTSALVLASAPAGAESTGGKHPTDSSLDLGGAFSGKDHSPSKKDRGPDHPSGEVTVAGGAAKNIDEVAIVQAASGNAFAGAGKVPSSAARACALSDISPTAISCSGSVPGNLLSNANVASQQQALAVIGFNWGGDFSRIVKIDSLDGRTDVHFGQKLYGETIVGFHFGKGAGLGEQATVFYKFDAGTKGMDQLALNILKGSSGAVLYRTGLGPALPPGDSSVSPVPEAATWAMIIVGFGLIGLALRRRSLRTVSN